MPFVRFHPMSFQSRSDPFVDLFTAALAAENVVTPTQYKSACAPAQYQTRSCAPRQTRIVKRYIAPKFDVSETQDSYILEGELPGVSNKSTISIDFEDAQTIVIKGEVSRVKRNFSKQTEETTKVALHASAAAAEKASITTTDGETVVYDDTASVTSNKSNSKTATVEDDVDESDTASNASFEVVDAKDVDVEMTETTEKTTEPRANKPQNTAKYWVTERPIGIFERNLENGLLSIMVPKREAFVRSIFIN
ncbi:hypothetical protein ABW20_dc0104490 [Dactylellina cionopaga]|nr:hypothetical protein ABW20_dc0104490 [Dactylellina cionopaga]